MDTPAIRLAKALLEAAKLHTRAAHQDAMAQAYRQQAAKPIYKGQTEVCLGKAGEVESLAAENRAKANLIKAEAEAAYKADTGHDAPPQGT